MKIGRTEIWFAFLGIFFVLEGLFFAALGYLGVIQNGLWGLAFAVMTAPVLIVLYILSKASAPKNWETDERYMQIANSSLRHGLQVGFFIFIQLMLIEFFTGWTIALRSAFIIVTMSYSLTMLVSRFIQERR